MITGWLELVWDWLEFSSNRLPELWLRTGQHLILTGVSTGLAILFGLPLGILATARQQLQGPLLAVIGLFQTIPSLAMLAILLTLVGKIGAVPAIIALTIYALLPIVRNTVTGINGVSPASVEAAVGMGMTGIQQLRLVQIPLAMPVIIAGIRTAAVVGVGVATLSAFIGAGGLGQFINRGLALYNPQLILLGAIPAAILAVLVDVMIGLAVWGIEPLRQKEEQSFKAKLKPVALVVPLLFLVLGLFSALGDSASLSSHSAKRIRIGSKNFTEQIILGELMAQMIEEHTDFSVERNFNLAGTMICHGALTTGEIDLYAEYTGTGLVTILKQKSISDADKVYDIVKTAYKNQFQLEWLQPFGFNNSYSLTVRSSDANKHQWQTISDLKATSESLRAGFTPEFSERPDGYPGMKIIYDINFAEVHDLEATLMYQAVKQREVDVICAYTTDGRIAAYSLQPLIDDLKFFPPYYAAPVVRKEFLEAHPEVGTILSRLGGIITDKTMQQLNYEVDEKGRPPAEVAHEFLQEQGLLKQK